jgi:hypothetical protein
MENWDSLVGTQMGIAVIITWAVNALKRSKYVPWLNEHSDVANKWIGIGVAAIASYGLTMSGDMSSGWQITIPPFDQLVNATIKMASGIGLQQGAYRITTLPTTSTPPDVMVVKTGIPPAKTTVETFPSPDLTDK